MTVFDRQPEATLAYGAHKLHTPKTPTSFRSERGRPYLRAGVQVQAVPQFTTLTLYSPISGNSPLPDITTSSTQISRPGRSGLKFP